MIRPRLLWFAAFLACGLGLLVTPSAVHAQTHGRSHHSLSVGGGPPALGQGPSALFTNPANLSVGPRDASLEIALADIRVEGGGSLLQFDHYTNTFTGNQTLSSTQVETTLSDWFGGEMRTVDARVDVVPLALTYRPRGKSWALGGAIRVRTALTSSMNRGFFDLLLRGTGENRTIPMDGRYRAYNSVDVTGAFSYTFPTLKLSVGVAPRLIVGTGFADGTLDSVVEVNENAVTHRFTYTARAAGFPSSEIYDVLNVFDGNPLQGQSIQASTSRAGLGGGLDLGATVQARPNLRVSLSLTDLGYIQWSQDAQTVTPTNTEFRFEGFNVNLDRIDREFDGDVQAYVEHTLDSLARGTYEQIERTRESFGTELPAAVHLGSSWRPTGSPITLNAGVSAGLNEEAGAVTTAPAVYFGGETKAGPVPLRIGTRLLGDRAASFAVATGLHVSSFRFEIGATVTPQSTFMGDGANYSVGMSLATIRF